MNYLVYPLSGIRKEATITAVGNIGKLGKLLQKAYTNKLLREGLVKSVVAVPSAITGGFAGAAGTRELINAYENNRRKEDPLYTTSQANRGILTVLGSLGGAVSGGLLGRVLGNKVARRAGDNFYKPISKKVRKILGKHPDEFGVPWEISTESGLLRPQKNSAVITWTE